LTKFQSKKDVMAYIAILMPSLILTALAIGFLVKSIWVPAVLLLIGAVTNLSMWFATYYQFREGQLFVRCGLFRWQIPIASIERVRKSKNMGAGPALSMDRLVITHSIGITLISPVKESEFLSMLQQKNQKISIEM
jgi:hypothetical protein